MAYNNPRAADLVPDVLRLWVERLRRTDSGLPDIFVSSEQVPHMEMSNEKGLLPLVCWHMDTIYRFAMGRPLGVSYRTNKASLLGCEVELGGVDKPMSEVLCFLFEAADDLLKHAPRAQASPNGIELSALVSKFKDELEVARARNPSSGISPAAHHPRAGAAIS